jgi:FixJ family two-component response regulator
MNSTPFVNVVDDDSAVRNALVRLITTAGHPCRGFETATEYMSSEALREPGCLLLDYLLPDINGIELQEQLRDLNAHVPIIFMSGYGDVPLTVRAMKLGAIDFLTKPVREAALLAAIDNALAIGDAQRGQQLRDDDVRARLTHLTNRERDVLNGILAGRLNKQIASALGIAEKTVKVHRGRLMIKMGVRHVAQLVQLADQVGYQPPQAPAPAPLKVIPIASLHRSARAPELTTMP